MAGCKYIIISGIDGNFDEFTTFIQPLLKNTPCLFVAYNRNVSFKENLRKLISSIQNSDDSYIVVGWSIGAVLGAFISNCSNVKTVIMINAFYDRRETLKRRNIECDENVCVSSIPRSNKQFILISGQKDDKILPENSLKIASYLGSENNCEIFTFPEANHSLSSFPVINIAKILNNVQYESDDNCCKKQ